MYYLILIIPTLLLLTGCAPKVIKVKDPNYKDSYAIGRGCGATAKVAKEVAKSNLSSNIVSNVSSEWENRRVRDNDSYSSSAKSISTIKSNFLIISPKFLNHTITRETFKDDIHCIDAVLDKSSVRKYNNIANRIYREIEEMVKRKDGKIKYNEKDKYASRVIRLYSKKIKSYNNIAHFINLLSGREIKDIFTKGKIKSMINAKPSVDFRVEGTVYYGKEFQVIPIVRDEGRTTKTWIVGREVIKKERLRLKFNNPGEHKITLIAKDKEGLLSKRVKYLNISNKAPIAKYRVYPNRDIFFVNEPIKFINNSYDTENDIAGYSWNIANSKFSKEKDLSISFNRVGNFSVALKVYDSHKKSGSVYGSIRVEGKNYKRMDIGMTKREVLSLLGYPKREINLNITSKLNSLTKLSERVISNFGLESRKAYLYDNYWYILEGKILKCMIYKKDFERKSCKWFARNKPYAIAKK